MIKSCMHISKLCQKLPEFMKISVSIKVLMAKLLVLFLLLVSNLVEASGELSPYYYEESCPLAEEIVRQVLTAEVYRNPRIAAPLLRVHFHDCFVLVLTSQTILTSNFCLTSE